MDKSYEEATARLRKMEPPFPRTEAELLRERWPEWGERLIAEITRIADGGSVGRDGAEDGYDGLFAFVVYLAAEKRDSRAYLPLVRVSHSDSDRAEWLFGDDVGSTQGSLLASVCDGDLAPLKALAEDRQAGMWCRYAALHAMKVRVIEGDDRREDFLEYLDQFCEREAEILRSSESEPDYETFSILTWAIINTKDLGAAPMLEKIRGWYAEGLIDEMAVGLRSFEKSAAMPVEECIAQAASSSYNRYFSDAVERYAGWSFFSEKQTIKAPEPEHLPSFPPIYGDPSRKEKIAALQPVRNETKVGRNDPCPCGSGKKYKKCCG